MSSVKVIKRDGIVTEFDIERIINAIYKANLETKELDVSTIEEFKDNHIVKSIIADIIKYYSSSKEDIHVEKIQDLVEENLIRFNLNKTAKAYILYRDKRSKVREASSYIANTIAEFTYKDANENESARSNANINADTAAGTMLYYGSETSKWFTRTQLLKPHLAKLHDEGYFHIHDLDYFAIGNTNCLQIPLDKLLKNGFDTGHGYVRSPSNIKTAASLACIALQSNQAEQYGGQSLAAFDFALAPYVAKTFIKELCKVVELDIVGESSVEELKEELTELSNECSLLSNPNKVIELLNSYFYDWEDDEAILYEWSENTYQYKRLKKYFDKALERTDKETYQAMEALVHNFCTMHSRAGNQICFSSINFGMDTSEEGRMVSKNLMLAQEAGMGNGETAIFPITIMSLMEGYNFNPGDPNYDLFKLSCRVSAKRLYPNWQNNNAPYNKKYFKPGNPDTITSVMGCRTRVIGNAWNPDRETTSGRGNLSFVTINLPLLAIESHGDIDLFFNKLDTMMDNAQEVLMDRYKIQSNKKAKNFPFLVMQGLMMDGEKLDPEDKLGDTIRNGTLSIGFCGLSECLTALTGKHHGESEESQELGLRIIKYMRKRMDDEAERTKYNWSLFATPAESVAGRFCKCIKKKYGDLKGISDKDYLTNSSHVDVAYNCSMTHKVNVEAPYHELCNAGAIGYLEMESDPLQNLEAFENIVKYMCSKDMGYIAISHPVDRCPVCHYVGIIGDTCPQCGRTEDGWPSRAKLEELRLKNKLITIPDWLE